VTTLALDLATTTGFAIHRADGRIESGRTHFNTKKGEGEGMRYVRFRAWLIEQKNVHAVDRVAYELVMAHGPGAQAGHVYGGLLAILQSFCEHHRITYHGHHVGTIKKAWTGKGNASKDEMVASAIARGFKPIDHNEADAIALLHVDLGRLPKIPPKSAKRTRSTAAAAPTF
jgi:crossover junction endodeoxyribonuclease RuvC